jgi:hypothetical protein
VGIGAVRLGGQYWGFSCGTPPEEKPQLPFNAFSRFWERVNFIVRDDANGVLSMR